MFGSNIEVALCLWYSFSSYSLLWFKMLKKLNLLPCRYEDEPAEPEIEVSSSSSSSFVGIGH